jgi:hypothetical protein
MSHRARVGSAVAAVDDAVLALDRALRDASSALTQDEWLEMVGRSQSATNRLAAVQDLAIASVARFEAVWAEDGTVATVDRGPGRVALDAADLVAPHLGASHHRAQQRVETAVRTIGRTPVPVDSDAHSDPTGLDGLHAAMRAGRLDPYRASVVADELLEAPAEVAEAVVAALGPHLDEPGPDLRRRTRRMVARISPDLLRQRAQRARRETGLRRWVAEPGVDAWFGTFPTERSAQAWAAIDALARRYVTDGVCENIEQARGRALTDLVVEHSDVRVQLILTAPADGVTEGADRGGEGERTVPRVEPTPAGDDVGTPAGEVVDAARALPDIHDEATRSCGPGPVGIAAESSSDGDLVLVHGGRAGEGMFVPATWLVRVADDVLHQPCDPGTGARVDPGDQLAGRGYRPSEHLVALVRARDGRCRFPGCSVASRLCDIDHVRPWPGGPTSVANLMCLCRRHHRIKQSPGWRLRLRPDAVAEWTDPRGHVTTTVPVDALEHVVLRSEPIEVTRPAPPALPSVLEQAVERRLDLHAAVVRRRRRAQREARAARNHQRVRRRDLEPQEPPPF